MSENLKSISLLFLVFFITMCNKNAEVDVEKNLALSPDNEFVYPDYLGGQVMSMIRIENSLFFTDMATRSIHSVSLSESDSVITVGSRGRGPGEYEFPLHLRAMYGEHLAWSDISKSEINVINTDGNFISTITHPYGGGRNFSFGDKHLLVTPGFSNLLNLVVLEDETQRIELFEISSKDRAFLNMIPGGGGVIIRNKAYAAMPHKPIFHIYDLETKTISEVVPPAFESYHSAFSTYYDSVERPSDIDSEYVMNSFLLINRVFPIQLENETFILTETSYEGSIVLFVFDHQFNLVFKSESDFSPLGINGTFIYGVQTIFDEEAESDEVTLTIKQTNILEQITSSESVTD